jgi:pimeloyl-ACP methyl ester carboxylesterase
MTRVASHPADPLDQAKIRFVDVDGIRTRYYEGGVGEPLILLHGGHVGFIDSLDTWSLNLPGLAEQFHVYAVDKIGEGHTDIPKRDEDYTYEATYEHAVKWLEVLGVKQAHILGHSRGGLLAASLAFGVPGLAKSVVVVNSATLAPNPDDPRLQSGQFYSEIDRRTPPGPPTRESLWVEPEANSYSTEHITEEYITRYLEIALLPAQLEGARKMKEGLNDKIFMPSLNRNRAEAIRLVEERGMPARTLVVWSRNDRSAPLAEVGLRLYERICARTREAELHVFNEAGHYTYREHPLEFNRLVRNFCLA